jgi:hypothetical protein
VYYLRRYHILIPVIFFERRFVDTRIDQLEAHSNTIMPKREKRALSRENTWLKNRWQAPSVSGIRHAGNGLPIPGIAPEAVPRRISPCHSPDSN